MRQRSLKLAITGLRWTLGVAILIEAILFVMPNARHSFAQTRMPDAIRLLLGWTEIVGAVLLLIPRTTVRGAWILAAVFAFAILIHLMHGAPNVANLIVYSAAAWVVGAERGNP